MGEIREGEELITKDEKYTVIAVSNTNKYVLERASDGKLFLHVP